MKEGREALQGRRHLKEKMEAPEEGEDTSLSQPRISASTGL